MIDGVIFDLDGTLWDTTREILKCYQQYVPDLSLWKMKTLMGKSISDIAFELDLTEEVVKDIQDNEVSWLSEHHVAPYNGVEALLQYLDTRDIPCYIVSNCQERYIECFLHTTGLERYFKDWVSYGDTGLSKVENVKHLIEKNNLDPKQTVLVGDTMGDKEAATENDIRWFVWAAYGFGYVQYYNGMIAEPLGLARFL